MLVNPIKPDRLDLMRSRTTEYLLQTLKEVNEILAPEPNCMEFGFMEIKVGVEQVLRERQEMEINKSERR